METDSAKIGHWLMFVLGIRIKKDKWAIKVNSISSQPMSGEQVKPSPDTERVKPPLVEEEPDAAYIKIRRISGRIH